MDERIKTIEAKLAKVDDEVKTVKKKVSEVDGKIDANYGMMDQVIKTVSKMAIEVSQVNMTLHHNGLVKNMHEVQDYILAQNRKQQKRQRAKTVVKNFILKHGWKFLLIGGLLFFGIVKIKDILGAIKLW